MKLNLTDFAPTKASFHLSAHPDKRLTLKPYSLRSQLYMESKYGSDKIEAIFKSGDMSALSDLAFFSLEHPHPFRTLEEFQEAIVTGDDRKHLMLAITQTLGVSRELIDRIVADKGKEAQGEGNAPNPDQPIGATSTTESPSSTAIQ